MAAHSEIIGDLKIPIGTYTVNEQGQPRTKRRHRQIGTVMKLTYDGGNEQLVAKINIEVFSIEMQALLRANKILTEGDDAVLCNVYTRESRGAATSYKPVAGPASDDADGGPF